MPPPPLRYQRQKKKILFEEFENIFAFQNIIPFLYGGSPPSFSDMPTILYMLPRHILDVNCTKVKVELTEEQNKQISLRAHCEYEAWSSILRKLSLVQTIDALKTMYNNCIITEIYSTLIFYFIVIYAHYDINEQYKKVID